MKFKKKKTVKVIEDFVIDYENEITCKVQVINDKLVSFSFWNEKLNLKLEPIENIDEVLPKHWSEHHKIAKYIKFNTIDDFKKFINFDNLFYLGTHRDGMVKDKNGNVVASIIILDDIFCSIWPEIGTPKVVDEVYEIIHKHEWVKKIDKVEISYYNREENKTDTLRIEILPTSEVLNEIMTRLHETYVSDMVKLELLAIMGYDKREKYAPKK